MPSVTLPGGVIEVEGTPGTYLKGVVVQEALSRQTMPRRPAILTQADIARVIRAAKQEGAPAVEVYVGGEVRIVIPLLDKQCADSLRTFLADRMRTLLAPENPLADSTEIIL